MKLALNYHQNWFTLFQLLYAANFRIQILGSCLAQRHLMNIVFGL